jgi:hypothetical protein
VAPAQDECACLWQGSFADVQEHADLVVAGDGQRRKGNAVDIASSERCAATCTLDSIRMWMQTRDYCRPPARTSPLRDRAGSWP